MSGEYVTHADLGGQRGHGPINPDAQGDPWHAAWERRAFAVTLAMLVTGAWNVDMLRAANETLPDYGDRSYYEIFIGGLLKMLDERGLVSADELAAGRSLREPPGLPNLLLARDVAAVLASGASSQRPPTTQPRFAVGQHVRTHTGSVPHHTRLPGYAKGKLGVIELVHGVHVFPDANASGQGEQPHWLYTVAFSADELWPDGAPGTTVSIEAWEPYLQAA
jgi:nitrile hydratase subunit beta